MEGIDEILGALGSWGDQSEKAVVDDIDTIVDSSNFMPIVRLVAASACERQAVALSKLKCAWQTIFAMHILKRNDQFPTGVQR